MKRFFSSFRDGFRRQNSASQEELKADLDFFASNSQIDRHLAEDQREDTQIIKLLMLGAGESGKSTIKKQIEYLYVDHKVLPPPKAKLTRDTVRFNVTVMLRDLIKCAHDRGYDMPPEVRQFYEEKEQMKDQPPAIEWTREESETILSLFESDVVQDIYLNRRVTCPNLMDNAEHFLSDIRRVISLEYEPTFEDYIRSKHRTTGVTSVNFEYAWHLGQTEKYRITDAGGQRNERRKWIFAFGDVVAIIYVVALSGYNQYLFEENKRNKLVESLDLFTDVLRLPVFQHKNFIVFLNKYDLFVEKLGDIPFDRPEFPDFKGDPRSPEDVVDFIKEKFVACNRKKKRGIYFEITTAINTASIDDVFGVVRDCIVRYALLSGGLL